MLLKHTAVESVILAILVLHNMLMTSSAKNIYCPTGLCGTGDVNRELTLGLCRNDNWVHNASITAKEIRDTYVEYFMNESVILAILVLHNMLMTSSAKNIYCPTGLCGTGDVNRELTLGLCRNDNWGHNASITAKESRDTYAEYFMNEVVVQWH